MLLKPSEIRYSQETISNVFSDKCQHRGKYIGETLDDICEGRSRISDIPMISVKLMKGNWVTADNRRLWVFKQLERLGKCSVILVKITKYIAPGKLNTQSDGLHTYIRRHDPGGIWHLKPSASLNEDSEVNDGQEVSCSSSSGKSEETDIIEKTRERMNEDSDFNDVKSNQEGNSMARPINLHAVKEKLQVAAIDFGTTYSGYAFSFRGDFMKDPLKIVTNQWSTGSNQSVSLKTSTCVLFDPQQKFHSFGFDAEDMYADLASEENHSDWYYFKRFKMMLYENKDLSRSTMLSDDKGKQMPAMTVFAESIKFLKHHFLDSCSDRQYGLEENEIHWVLTVPAIWDDAAKQFMREAAITAGIDSDHLSLALEPEAASMFCKHLPVNRVEGAKGSVISCFGPGTRYLVLDAGGGTVDITVHETQRDHTVRELFKANGGPWGGTRVDEAFHKFLAEISSEDTLKYFKLQHMDDFLDLMREFEIKKTSISPEMDQRITFKIPVSFNETYTNLHGNELRMSRTTKGALQQNISFTGDKLRVQSDVVKNFFTDVCQAIVSHLKEIFRRYEVSGTDTILMVGGFSESRMLQAAIKQNFSDKTVVIPAEAGLAVLKGAVIFGHNPTVIATRVSKVTYGVGTSTRFKSEKHPRERYFIAEGEEYCSGVFDIHVNIGEEVEDGTTFETKRYVPVYSNAKKMSIPIHTADKSRPEYTDEEGCKKLGCIEVDLSDLRPSDKKVAVCMKYGGTELHVEAKVVKTGQKANAKFEFLS